MTVDPAAQRWRSRPWAVLGVAIFIGYLIIVGYLHIDGRRSAARGEAPLLTDFTSLYAASMLVKQQPASDLYIPKEMYQAGLRGAQAAYGGNLSEKQARTIGFHPWMYPPTFILAAIPLAYLSYFSAWCAWLAVTAIPYLAALRAILQGQSFWLIGLAAPPVFYNIMYGQTGFLTAGFIGLGLAWLVPRPMLAGICIGLAGVKPHFGILIPLALACGGHWRVFGAASATVIATIIFSLIAFGDDPWFGFIGTSVYLVEGFGIGAYNFKPMVSIISTMRLAGGSIDSAWLAQIASAAIMSLIVAWTWWCGRARRDTLGLQSAILCLTTLLAVPSVYLYDLMLLVPAMAWIWLDMHQRGARVTEMVILIASFASLHLIRPSAIYMDVQIGTLFVLTMLLLALHRYRGALASTDANAPPVPSETVPG